MAEQAAALRAYVDGLPSEFPFHRWTEGRSPLQHAGDAPLVLGASCITPFVGVFAQHAIDQVHLAPYPAAVMTAAEYDAMPVLVPTACDTVLHQRMTREQQDAHGRSILLVGVPTAPAAQVMSQSGTRRAANACLVEDWSDACRTVRKGDARRLLVRDDYITLERLGGRIPRGAELLVDAYDHAFLRSMPPCCDVCFLKVARDEQRPLHKLYQCTYRGCELCFHAACLRTLWPRFNYGIARHVDTLMCPDHHELAKQEAQNKEEEEEEID